MTDSQETIVPGAYYVDDKGDHHPLEKGSYYVDDNGDLNSGTLPTVNWQSAIDKIKWEEAHKLIENMGKRGTDERKINLVGMYVLVAIVISIAGWLAFLGIIEGQAIVGFLGAAIGYLLSRGTGGVKG